MKKKKVVESSEGLQNSLDTLLELNMESKRKRTEDFQKSLALILDLNIVTQKDVDEGKFDENNAIELLSLLTNEIEDCKESKSALKTHTYRKFLDKFKR